ncbi:AzlC family ABC transporter permease [Mesorhizobium sp. LHD-90]|uniref:AzlC family ABC transporter permease n=1 Tax=Mesorhizobium sp. LHD-90 TaxID=3071414 RepID=UPI0027DEF970|nr:AzlC family ABC transporter permease [Mesorhizobium sp. LHD-90]MDQ6437760.1 AzlC family ABC transporter permease [Mesorhizobium sp. LHD-90]
MSGAESFPPPSPQDGRRWYLRGAAAAFSVPGWILATAYVGFAGLAKESGFSLGETMFMTAAAWALPANVVLIGAILSGASLFWAAFAVALSSFRMMPMVVALMPELRAARTGRLTLYILSHFVAVTSWVLAMERVRKVPREARTAWFAGLGSTLLVTNTLLVGVVYLLVGGLPGPVTAALLFLTPIYFLTSLWGSAREKAGHVAMLAGLVLGPVFHTVWPGFDLLAAGLVGGIIAFAFHLLTARRAAP